MNLNRSYDTEHSLCVCGSYYDPEDDSDKPIVLDEV